MSNLQLPNPATFAQRVAALEQALSGNLIPPPIATLVVTGGAAGTYSYVVVAKYPPMNVPSGVATTTTGPTALSAASFNTISWTAAPAVAEGNIIPVYDVYRTAGGGTQGRIAVNISAVTPQGNQVALTIVDNGLVADGTVAPPFNGSGVIQGGTQESVYVMGTNTTIPIGAGLVVMNKVGSVTAATLAAPIAGTDDGKTLTVLSTVAQANTITTPAAAINGTLHIATFTAAIGNWITFIAYNGIWYVVGNLNATLT